MRSPIRHVDPSSENGAVAVTTAILLVVLVLFAALIVDLGALKVDRSTDQSIADAAVTAGMKDFSKFGAEGACNTAMAYAITNLGLTGSAYASALSIAEADCTAKFGPASGFVCSDSPVNATTAEAPAGEYVFYVTHPVDADSPLMNIQPEDSDLDGTPCERMGVAVERNRDYILAGVGGFQSSSTTVSAVARETDEGDEDEFATLIVLDRHNCNVLETEGGAFLLVSNLDDETDPSYDPVLGDIPGNVTVDSSASVVGDCSGQGVVVDASNQDNGRICAGVPSEIALAIQDALLAGNTPPACDSLDETLRMPATTRQYEEADLTNGRLDPEPIVDDLITRSPVDHSYNCKPSYSTGDETAPNQQPLDPIDGCDDPEAAYIDDLVGALGGSGLPSGFTLWGGSCTISTAETLISDTYFNCSQLDIASSGSLTSDGHHIVVNGGIKVAGAMTVNTPNDGAGQAEQETILFLRTAKKANGSRDAAKDTFQVEQNGLLKLWQTHVYMHTAALDVRADNLVVWTAPLAENGDCESTILTGVTVHCFDNLALWTNDTGKSNISGSGQLQAEGVFFTPNAGRLSNDGFVLNGGPGQTLLHAQFFAHSIKINGGGFLRMTPDPNRILSLPLRGTGLIR